MKIETQAPAFTSVHTFQLEAPTFILDAKAYQDEFADALLKTSRWKHKKAPLNKFADVYIPNRIKLITTPEPSHGAEYLKAHDIFNLLPSSSRYLVESRTSEYQTLILKTGTILTPSSGRNLGPLAYVGSSLSGYAMTDIMRIVPEREDDGYLLYAFLMTATGQALLKKGRSGTNIDHLSANDVKKISVLVPTDALRTKIVDLTREAETLLNNARTTLRRLDAELLLELKISQEDVRNITDQSGINSYSLDLSDISLRLDAAFYNPSARKAFDFLIRAGGEKLGAMADLRMMGRYKRYYVDKDSGTPIVSGRQLFQLRPVSLKYISDRSFTDPSEFRLQTGWTVFTCDGRSEEALGNPSFVSSYRSGWMASNHVMRAVPKTNIHPGFLYLALRNPLVQIQLKHRATGSVIDALSPKTISDAILPKLDKAKMDEMGSRAACAFEDIGKSQEILHQATELYQGEIESNC